MTADDTDARTRPTVSVVIPVKDDSEELARCLTALSAQSRVADEIIVVDNGSSDDSADVAVKAGATVVSWPQPGIPAASSRGYDEASGDLILRLDADCVPHESWIDDVVMTFEQHPDASALTGTARFIDGPAPLRGSLAVLYLGAYSAVSALALGHRPLFGSNLAMRRSAWQEVRGSVHRDDPELHDDLDLSFHLGERHRIRYLDSEPMGISMRPFWSARLFAHRTYRGFRTIAIHWPRDFPPYRLRRMLGRSNPEPAAAPPLVGRVEEPAVHVMSWNIRRRETRLSREAHRWDHRAPRVRQLLKVERPTVLCVQEALPDQARFVRDSLGDTYRFVGHGRQAEGRGEGCPVFYDSARLEVVGWQQTALSDTPARQGSTSWGNLIPRIRVSVTFRDKATSRQFRVINTHLDHLSSRSRRSSAQAIRRDVEASTLPTLVVGDLNASAGSVPLTVLLAGGILADSWHRARARASRAWGTFPNYRAPRQGGRKIDWILAAPSIEVLSAAINPWRRADGWASDHLPVQAVIVPPERGGDP